MIKIALKNFYCNDDGATAIEYGLIAGLIAIVIISALTSIGTGLSGRFTSVANNLT